MPDASGKLTEEENQKIRDWWKEHWKQTPTCPVCGSAQWETSAFIMEMSRHGIAPKGIRNIVFPHVAVMSPCGYSMFFNATKMGLFDSWRPLVEDAPAQTGEADNG